MDEVILSSEIDMHFRIPDFPLGALLATILCVVGLFFVSPEMPSIWLWEALVAISFIVWALGAGFLASPRKDQLFKAKEGTAIPNAINSRRSDISADMAALIEIIIKEGRANRKEERREDREGRVREQITIVFIGITMFAIILQVHEMVKAYEPIHEQAKAAVGQATAAIKQATAAATQAEGVKDQTEAAKQAALAARENSITAGRAWLGPNGATMVGSPVLQQEGRFVVAYQNTGREPALAVITTSDAFSVSSDQQSLDAANSRVSDDLNKCLQLNPIDGAQVVYPSVGFSGNQMTVIFAKETMDTKVLDGSKMLVATGCFAYKTFNKVHHSAFCFLYNKSITALPNLNFCPGGAYAD